MPLRIVLHRSANFGRYRLPLIVYCRVPHSCRIFVLRQGWDTATHKTYSLYRNFLIFDRGLCLRRLLRHLCGRRQLRPVPTPAQRLNQLHRRRHLLDLQVGQSLLVGEQCGLRDGYIDVGIDARIVTRLLELHVTSARSRQLPVGAESAATRMRTAASASSTCWNAVSTDWR